MDAVLTDEQLALTDAANGLASSGLAAARAMLAGGPLPDQPSRELLHGFNGLGIPEAAGGIGGTLVDVAIVARALGRTVCPTPWLAHQMALQALHAAGVGDLGAMGEGWAVLVDQTGTAALAPDATTTVEGVREGQTATVCVLVSGDALSVRPVVGATARKAMDPTRPVADLSLGAVMSSAETGGQAALRRARTILAASQTGVGLGAVERAAAYAMGREQFGKVVATFQGVSHQLSDAWTAVELAWSLALHAAWAVDSGQPDAATAVEAATAKASNAAIFAAERGMQVHGGIGITWEADPHLALRRAMADDVWLTSARDAELALGRSLLLG